MIIQNYLGDGGFVDYDDFDDTPDDEETDEEE